MQFNTLDSNMAILPVLHRGLGRCDQQWGLFLPKKGHLYGFTKLQTRRQHEQQPTKRLVFSSQILLMWNA